MTLAEMVDKVQRRTDWARPDSTYDAINSAAQFIFHRAVKESKSKAFLKKVEQTVDFTDDAEVTKSAGDVIANTADGGSTWVAPSNAEGASDNVAATNDSASALTGFGNWLLSRQYGFAFAANRRITGIKVEVLIKQSLAAAACITTIAAQLVKDGERIGDEVASETKLTNAYQWVAIGSESEMFGRDWTVAEINDVNFGAALKFTTDDLVNVVSVDAFRVTVYADVSEFVLPADVEQMYRVRERVNASDDWRLVLPEGLSDPGQLSSSGAFGEAFFDDPISEFTFFGPFLDDVAAKTAEQIYKMKIGPVPSDSRELEFFYAARFVEIKNANSKIMIPRGAHDALIDIAVAEVLDEDDDTKAETYRSKASTKLEYFMAVQRQLERTGPPTQDSYLL